MTDFDFPAAFSRWFERQQFTRESFAARVGTSRQLLRRWLKGECFPRDKFCERLYPMTELPCFSPEHRDEARRQSEASIPTGIIRKRKQAYDADPDTFRKRSLASSRKRHEAARVFVLPDELEALRKDPRERKNVCRQCGEILKDIGPHLGQIHDTTVEVYKEKWGFLRSRNATRSKETQQKQSAAMKAGGHEPPEWTRELLPLAQKASLETNVPGSARLEERLLARGKVLGARPQFWKRTDDDDVVTDAKLAQLRLRGMTMEKIAERVGMTIAPVFFRLKRLGFPRRTRLFEHGEPVNANSFVALVYDFDLTVEQAAERVGISVDWAGRLVRGKATVWLRHETARNVVKVREELLRLFRTKPTVGKKGVGRPKQLPLADEDRLIARYDRLHEDLRTLRAWILTQQPMPKFSAIWDQLCRWFRSRHLRALQFSPSFFAWVEKNYIDPSFRAGNWIPHELAREFVAFEFDVVEGFAAYLLTHPRPGTAEK
jgi:transcriptional regulator with XRE-family HTH domain